MPGRASALGTTKTSSAERRRRACRDHGMHSTAQRTMLKNSASCAPFTASSRSQSSHTTMGELPPCGTKAREA